METFFGNKISQYQSSVFLFNFWRVKIKDEVNKPSVYSRFEANNIDKIIPQNKIIYN